MGWWAAWLWLVVKARPRVDLASRYMPTRAEADPRDSAVRELVGFAAVPKWPGPPAEPASAEAASPMVEVMTPPPLTGETATSAPRRTPQRLTPPVLQGPSHRPNADDPASART